MDLAEARQAVVDGLIAGTKTPDDKGWVESVTIGTASKADCRVCLRFRVDRFHTVGPDSITDELTGVTVSWEENGETVTESEALVYRFGPAHLDPARPTNGMIPRKLYAQALKRLSELYAVLYT